MIYICDTDVLSAFGKADAVKLLKKLFGKIYVPPAVFQELVRTKQFGYVFVDSILGEVDILTLSEEEFKQFEVILESETSLHVGELQGIVLCRFREGILLTNDRLVKTYCGREDIQYLDLEEILRSMRIKNILSRDELTTIIDKIEKEDKTIIKAREDILQDQES